MITQLYTTICAITVDDVVSDGVTQTSQLITS